MTTLLRWALLNSCFAAALAAGAVLYDGHVHPAAVVAIAAVLVVYMAGTAHIGLSIAHDRKPVHADRAAGLCPKVAILGSVCGFLIAFSGGVNDVQQRVLGASTGLLATFVGIACMIMLELQDHLASHAEE